MQLSVEQGETQGSDGAGQRGNLEGRIGLR